MPDGLDAQLPPVLPLVSFEREAVPLEVLRPHLVHLLRSHRGNQIYLDPPRGKDVPLLVPSGGHLRREPALGEIGDGCHLLRALAWRNVCPGEDLAPHMFEQPLRVSDAIALGQRTRRYLWPPM